MTPAEGIRKLGFRRWYERQLIEGHAWFVTCFLCMILALACAEDIGFREGGLKPVLMIGLIGAAAAVGFSSLQRYRRLLDRAEGIAEQSTCARCTTYGRLLVIGARDGQPPLWMRVRCRHCGHEWVIE